MNDIFETVIEAPISRLNRDLDIDWPKTFAIAAKTVLKVSSLKFDEAFEEVLGGLEALDLKDDAPKPEVLTWLLVNRALIRATLLLLAETRDRHPDMAFKTEGDGAAAIDAGRLMKKKIKIGRDLLARPDKLPFIVDVKKMLRTWFIDLGLGAAEAGGLAGRLDAMLPRSLDEEWRDNPALYGPVRAWLNPPTSEAFSRALAWERAAAHARALPGADSVLGAPFALRDVYVPLRGYRVVPEVTARGGRAPGRHAADPEDGPGGKPKAELFMLDDELVDWLARNDKDDFLRVVSGGPGSGKSSLSRMLAARLADEAAFRVLHVPLHLLALRVPLRQALASYCHDVIPDFSHDPFDALEEDRVLVLLLDGLDELSSGGRAAQAVADEFAEDVIETLRQVNVRRQRVKAIIGGRELVVQGARHTLRREERVLHVLPYVVSEEYRRGYDWSGPDDLIDADQRDQWWAHYGRETGRDYDAMPEAIREHDKFGEISATPLLNYLLAWRFDKTGAFSAEESANDVYWDLIADVYERRWREPGGREGREVHRIGDVDTFIRILEEVALAVWHSGSRAARRDDIDTYLQAAGLDGYFEEFEDRLTSGVANLVLSFFFRQGDLTGEETFEFTHKSFGEYLVARRLADAAREVADLPSHRHDRALLDWAEVAGPAMLDRAVFSFLPGEFRPDEPKLLSRGESLARLLSRQLTTGFPIHKTKRPPETFADMRGRAEQAELALLAIIDAFYRAANAATLSPGEWHRARIVFPDRFAFKGLVERLQALGSRVEGSMPWRGLVQGLLGNLRADVRRAESTGLAPGDESGNGSYTGERTNHYLARTDFSRAHLSRAHLSRAHLSRAHLSRAHLSRADLSGADLSRAHLSRAHLSRATLSGAVLDREPWGAIRNLAEARGLQDVILDPGAREKYRLPPAAPGNPELTREDEG